MQATSETARCKAGQLALQVLRSLFSAAVRRCGGAAGKDHLEVELKFKIAAEDVQRLRDLLPRQGFRYTTTVSMSDTFLPASYEGEIMRIRQERNCSGLRRTVLTVKQWITTRTGRTRKEAEADVPSTVALLFLIAGRFLSDKALLGFSKNRELYESQLNGHEFVVSIDEVFGLGSFSGWYLEAEVLLGLGEDPCRFEQAILEQVQTLLGGERMPVKQTYREMLLESLK